MLLRTRSTSAMMPPAIITGTPPRCMRHTTIPAPMNATPAVMNQPPITEMTPVMRNTALSRPQALSASDVPIATMNVTNVVDRGSFIDVPQAINIPASIRFTAPRTRSNAAPSSGWAFDESRRRLMTRFRPWGRRSSIHENVFMAPRTSERPRRDEPNISSPWLCELNPTVVCVTWRAFLEVVSDTTIISPAPTRK